MFRERPVLWATMASVWLLKWLLLILGGVLPWRWLAQRLAALHDWLELVGLTWLTEAACYCLARAQERR
jgi:hypothetical protein